MTTNEQRPGGLFKGRRGRSRRNASSNRSRIKRRLRHHRERAASAADEDLAVVDGADRDDRWHHRRQQWLT